MPCSLWLCIITLPEGRFCTAFVQRERAQPQVFVKDVLARPKVGVVAVDKLSAGPEHDASSPEARQCHVKRGGRLVVSAGGAGQ
jgi:hypothetical protein